MAYPSKLSHVKDTIDGVLTRLAAIAPSPAVDDLRANAEACLAEAGRHDLAPPSAEERESFTRRVLALHLAVAKLESRSK